MKPWTWFAWPLTLGVAVVLTWFASLYVFEQPRLDPRVQQRTLSSAVLGETRAYLVHLPEGYADQPDQRYPVIYVLDGSSQDLHTAASAALMARIGVLPGMIVVGIPNVSGPGRQRDYTPPGMRQDLDEDDTRLGGGDRFLDFIETELVPAVEGEFRTNGRRELAGHSRGGLLVMHAFVSRPGQFAAFHAHSPALWRDDQAMVERLQAALAAGPGAPARLFLSLGEHENPRMAAAYEAAVAVLSDSAPPGLRWRAYRTPGADHGNNGERATPVGLQWSNAP